VSWYKTAFRGPYLDLYRHRSEEAAVEEAAFAVRAMGLAPDSLLLDLGCGAGRHARAIAAGGLRVVGLDLSRELLAAAEGVARVRADMRRLPLAGVFDAAASFFTSFGYFDDDENRGVLGEVARILRSGGVFFLDFLSAPAVRANLVAESEEEHEGRRYHFRRRIEGGRVLKDVRIVDEGLTLSYTESVRLYARDDLVRLLAEAGIATVACYGDFDGRDYTTDAPRCILVGRTA